MQELIGKKVTVISEAGSGERQDVGIIDAFDGTVLKLTTERGVLYFIIHQIRMIKPF